MQLFSLLLLRGWEVQTPAQLSCDKNRHLCEYYRRCQYLSLFICFVLYSFHKPHVSTVMYLQSKSGANDWKIHWTIFLDDAVMVGANTIRHHGPMINIDRSDFFVKQSEVFRRHELVNKARSRCSCWQLRPFFCSNAPLCKWF